MARLAAYAGGICRPGHIRARARAGGKRAHLPCDACCGQRAHVGAELVPQRQQAGQRLVHVRAPGPHLHRHPVVADHVWKKVQVRAVQAVADLDLGAAAQAVETSVAAAQSGLRRSGRVEGRVEAGEGA